MTKTINSRLKLQLSNSQKVFEVLNQSVPVLIGIFIFFNPFPHTTAIKEICFYLAVLIVLILVVFRRSTFIFKTPLTLPLIFFLLWATLSIFWSLNMENSIHDVRAHLLNHIILYFLLINSFSSRKGLATLAWIVVISAAIFSVAGMFYFYIILDNPIGSRFGHLSTRGPTNVFPELGVNFIGTITVFSMLICLHYFFQERHLYRRTAIVACLIPLFIATFLTQSNGTFTALMLAITIKLSLKAKKIVPFILLAVAGIVVMTPLKDYIKISSLESRSKINYVTYEVIKDYPIAGIGFGMQTFIENIDKKSYINSIPKKKRPTEIYTPHNWLLSIAVRLGIIGLILFLYIIVVFGKMCWETIRNPKDDDIKDWGYCTVIAFVAYFTIGIVEPVFLFKASATIFYVILAMITILWRLNQGEAT